MVGKTDSLTPMLSGCARWLRSTDLLGERSGKFSPLELMVMRFNHRKFNDMATEIILTALYEYANPTNLFSITYEEMEGRKEKAIHNYQNDPMTNARVKNIVAMLGQNIGDCFDA